MRAYQRRRRGAPEADYGISIEQAVKPAVLQPQITDDLDDLPLSWRQADATKPAPLAPFAYQGRQIRVINDEQGMPWFVAADVCAVLALPDTHKAVGRLDDDEKATATVPTLGGTQSMTTINESGLYSLILGSRKPEARAFKRWVTHEVLPTIRRTGQYAVSGAQPGPQPPALPPSSPAILIRASNDREAAQAWCDAVEATVSSAIRRRLSPAHRDDSAIPISSHWRRMPA